MDNFRDNGNYQNTVLNTDNNFNPYQNQYFGQNDKGTSYTQGMNSFMPQPMPGNVREDILYPVESSLATPFLNIPVPEASSNNNFAEGGIVQKNKRKEKNNPYPALAEMIRMQGKGEDTILAHINPLEAQILGLVSGGGSINPQTRLPQFGFFNKPVKATRSFFTKPRRAAAEIVGLGSALFGGPIGGAIGGAGKEIILGRPKNALSGAISGGIQGAVLPGVGKLAGQGLSSMGATTIGNALQNYGTSNMGSWLGNMGQMGQGVSGLFESAGTAGKMGKYGSNALLSKMYKADENGSALENYNRAHMTGVSAGDDKSADDRSFIDSLMGKSKNFFSEPSNLLTTAVLANSVFNRPKEKKEKSPEEYALDEKRRAKALRLTPAELAEKEAYDLAIEHARRRNERKKFLPEERLNIEPLYTRTNTPEEYGRTGRWLNYYNNPEYSGNPIVMKMGGEVHPKEFLEIEEFEYPMNLGTYIQGETRGQDDQIDAKLSDGEFVIPADVVSDLGDGNNEAGAKEFYKFMANIRKHKRGGKEKLPPKAKSLADYMRS